MIVVEMMENEDNLKEILKNMEFGNFELLIFVIIKEVLDIME